VFRVSGRRGRRPIGGHTLARTYTADEKKVVAHIVKLRRSGKGYPAIANALNEKGVPTFGRKGAHWFGPTVRAVCLREFGAADASLKAAGKKRPTPKVKQRARR
jgi:hypothetical protein